MKNNYIFPTIADDKRLAEQAQLDADLAEEKTRLAKKKPVDNSQESNRVLPEKIKRTDQ